MKLSQAVFYLLAFVTTIHAIALPAPLESTAESAQELWKRRGGGGGRGGGGFSSGGRSSGGGSSSSGRTASTSNRGGLTSSGSGIQPRPYRGGSYYGGGAAVPYRSGSKSPRGIAPVFLGAGALAFFPGIWLYGAYAYSYPGRYYYHNQTSNQNETRPVNCYCGRFATCGCDSNNETDYVTSVANNRSIARVANVDGEDTLVINGTLPNGTTAASAAGLSFSQGPMLSGWIIMASAFGAAVWFI
ncbi:hypothetical protein LTR37_008593 [Vermiconidia calcicola]|uniref:Uncharacterized protein n=1 Tax=Vermiconidia calcicola TaxID=1690605 RepID=A0ACC3NAE2_9PEZI|nr:hypothetical protein LTR37_008593 [Vermiconidia calcicola]